MIRGDLTLITMMLSRNLIKSKTCCMVGRPSETLQLPMVFFSIGRKVAIQMITNIHAGTKIVRRKLQIQTAMSRIKKKKQRVTISL